MWLLGAANAFYTLLSLLILPAAGMLAIGLFTWYRALQQQHEERKRLGRMLTMFGIVFLVILLVISAVLQDMLHKN